MFKTLRNILGLGELPAYCRDCGCALKEDWISIRTDWNSQTGEGITTEQKFLVCPNYDEDEYYWLHKHYLKGLEIKEIPATKINCKED